VTRQLARRRRRESLAGLVVAALGVVVAVVAVVALQHPDGWSAGQPAAARAAATAAHASPASSPPSSTAVGSSPSPTPSATAPSVRLPLVVVNSTGRLGLAAAAAERFRAGGWTVSLLANFTGPVSSSCVYYDPSAPHARDAAMGLQRQFPDIRRIAARFDPLPAGPLVVVLADDYSATLPAGPSGGQRDTGAVR
jgi:hypothetical protein